MMMTKPPLDLTAVCKLWLGPDFEAEGEGMGKGPDIEFFDTVEEGLQRYQRLGPRKYGARIETSAGFYGQAEIEAALKA